MYTNLLWKEEIATWAECLERKTGCWMDVSTFSAVIQGNPSQSQLSVSSCIRKRANSALLCPVKQHQSFWKLCAKASEDVCAEKSWTLYKYAETYGVQRLPMRAKTVESKWSVAKSTRCFSFTSYDIYAGEVYTHTQESPKMFPYSSKKTDLVASCSTYS